MRNIFKKRETPIVVSKNYNRGVQIKSVAEIRYLADTEQMFYHPKYGINSCKFLLHMQLKKVLDMMDDNELFIANKIKDAR